jgi:hypothetical protein
MEKRCIICLMLEDCDYLIPGNKYFICIYKRYCYGQRHNIPDRSTEEGSKKE